MLAVSVSGCIAGKSRPLGGRPQIEMELRVLIWRMALEARAQIFAFCVSVHS
jgi:hypothetical protein